MSAKEVRALQPGDQFVTPGGRTLTVVKVRPAWMEDFGYVEVLTREPYAPGEHFTAHGQRMVEVVA